MQKQILFYTIIYCKLQVSPVPNLVVRHKCRVRVVDCKAVIENVYSNIMRYHLSYSSMLSSWFLVKPLRRDFAFIISINVQSRNGFGRYTYYSVYKNVNYVFCWFYTNQCETLCHYQLQQPIMENKQEVIRTTQQNCSLQSHQCIKILAPFRCIF